MHLAEPEKMQAKMGTVNKAADHLHPSGDGSCSDVAIHRCGELCLADHSDCRDQWRSARHGLEQRGGHSADGAIYG